MNVLDVQGIFRSYDGVNFVVQNLSFSIPKGTICGFIGPNGAGKTTTMRICATLDLADGGDVFVNGYNVNTHPREVRKHIGYMPDSFPVEPTILISEMLEFFGRAHGLYGQELRNMMDSVIAFTNLEGLLHKQFQELSKGMKQRAALGTILMHDPDLLILDEPAAGLDPRARIDLRNLLKLLAAQGKSVLISSHILSELSEICDQVVVLEQGKIQGNGVFTGLQTPKESKEFRLKTLADPEMVATYIATKEHVSNVSIKQEFLIFEFTGNEEDQAEFLADILAQGFKPIRFAAHEVNLEDIFMSVTKGYVQ